MNPLLDYVSPLCSLCNQGWKANEEAYIHDLCQKIFHKKCWSDAFSHCPGCNRRSIQKEVVLQPVDIKISILILSLKRFQGSLTSKHIIDLLNHLSIIQSDRVSPAIALLSILSECAGDEHPDDVAGRHAALLDLHLVYRAGHLVNEAFNEENLFTLEKLQKLYRSVCAPNNEALRFIQKSGDAWMRRYCRTFLKLSLKAPIVFAFLKSERELYRLKMRKKLTQLPSNERLKKLSQLKTSSLHILTEEETLGGLAIEEIQIRKLKNRCLYVSSSILFIIALCLVFNAIATKD